MGQRQPGITALPAVIFALGILLTAQPARAQQVGFVQDIEGRWRLNNSREVSLGQSLPSGAVISNPSPTEFDRIAIANTHGEIIKRVSCKVSRDCSKAIILPRAGKSTGFFSAAYGAVMSLIWGEPDRYAVTGVRGEDLPESVIELRNQRLDLSSIFKKRDSGRYYLRLRPLARKRAPVEPAAAPIIFDWDAAKPSTIAVALNQGLYEVTLLDPFRGGYKATNSTAWILIVSPARYAKANLAFHNMLMMTEKWDQDVSLESKRSFLRAALESLASKSSRPG